MDQLKLDIVSFLESRKEIIFERWKEKIIIPTENDYKKVILRGELLFEVMLHAFSLEKEALDQYLIKITSENAEYLKINETTNFSYIIYNANIAKNEMLIEVSKYHSSWEEIRPVYIKLSETIDRFLFYVTNYYTSLKDEQIEETKHTSKNNHEDRLTLLGQMTSSFVHEFRNPLTTVHGFVQLLRSENPELPYMDIILNELEQLKFRITQFLMLSRKEVLNQEVTLFSLNELLDQIASFIYPKLLEANVELERELEDNLYVTGYIEEIRQVLINIIFNAIDVLTEQMTSSVIKIKGYLTEDHSIVLETSNTGPKIPEQLLNTIFEPFVTTKKTGTGLGLYVCKEIIEKHNGQLYCTSDDEWTTFTIKLPPAETKNDETRED
ncbi:ATP-binding protein [Lederbergia wuyishanensis]|uniref:histidine kinase n=1 Tax=Lederbergia wuyishanensis TaxID=1347903 RepID=A0ABU0CYM8_9BACI|nr:HAMP domain-containing sensor histidine kinase [Lederbergia wuyishanensis]MCJ8005882.1 HAMP domain-containing histidine kinase [Lederbergia wuyishanensis]MDQ0341247.1 signal transduction histidine kinase [Lederbergia wuyishanensis]